VSGRASAVDSAMLAAQASAQADADRHFGDAAATPWRPARSDGARRRRAAVWIALLSLALFAVASAMRWFGSAEARVSPQSAAAPVAVMDATTGGPAPHEAAPMPVDQPSPPPSMRVERRGGLWHIDADGVAREAAVRQLAQTTGSTITGSPAALATARPLRLHWRGNDLARAWAMVLTDHVSFATQCGALRCQVWLVDPPAKAGAIANRKGLALAGRTPYGSAAAPKAPITTADVISTVAPSDSTDPRVAAHHD
jgi:hypothetical protein